MTVHKTNQLSVEVPLQAPLVSAPLADGLVSLAASIVSFERNAFTTTAMLKSPPKQNADRDPHFQASGANMSRRPLCIESNDAYYVKKAVGNMRWLVHIQRLRLKNIHYFLAAALFFFLYGLLE